MSKRVRRNDTVQSGTVNTVTTGSLAHSQGMTVDPPTGSVALALAAMERARASGDVVRYGECALVMAKAYWSNGDLEAALRYVEIALAEFERGGQRRRLGTTYKLHAMLFISLDRVSLALAAALKSLGYPDLNAKDRMYLYATIAMCFHHLVDLPTGGRVLEEYAWPEAEQSGDPQTIVACASRCAGLMHDYACWAMDIPNANTVGADKPPLEPAPTYLARGKRYLTICESHFPQITAPERGWALDQKGMIVTLADGWDAARPIFEEALAVSADFPRQQVATLLAAGTSARIARRWDVARDFLLRARSQPAAEPAHTQRMLAYELSYVFQALGESDAATEEVRAFAHLQTRKTRLADQWITDADNKRRYGGRLNLTAAQDLVLRKVQPAALKRAIEYIEKHLRQRLLLSEVARQASVSTRTLQNLFKVHQGLPASEFIRERRMQHADELLRRGNKSVGQVAESSGYSSAANFSRDYRRRFGRMPSSVLRSGADS